MQRSRALTIGLALIMLLAAPVVWAQSDGGFFVESLHPTESIAADGSGGNTIVPGSNEYEIDLELPSGLSLYRNFQREQIELGDTPFDTGIREQARSAATLTLGQRTVMNFSRDERIVSDVMSDLLETRTETAMQFQQGFGGGGSSGMLTLSRALVSEQEQGESELSTLTQSVELDTGLGEGRQLAAAFTQRESEESAFRLHETQYSGDLRMALSGGEGRAHYGTLSRTTEGNWLEMRDVDLVAPFAIQGGTLSAEHHQSEKLRAGFEEIHRSTAFSMPLDIVLSGASMGFSQETKLKQGVRNEQTTESLVVPLSLFGQQVNFEHSLNEKIKNDERNRQTVQSLTAPMSLFGHDTTLQHTRTETVKGESAFTDQRLTRLAMAFSTGNAVMERLETARPSGDDVQHSERLRFQTPQIRLSGWAQFSANQTRRLLEGEEQSRTSHIALNLQPFRPLDVRAGYTVYREPGEESITDRDVRTSLALSETARLQGSITEQEQREGPPIILRHLELQRDKPSEHALGLRFGYTSYGDQIEDDDTVMLAEVSVGSDTDLGLSATYTEYNEKKMLPLAEPSTSVELRAGDPAQMGMRAGFLEQASREEPERSLGLAMPAFGGALRLDYTCNPLDPRGKHVMLSDVYEVAFARDIFGGVDMDLGYRYFLPHGEDEGHDHFFRLQLAGGEVNGGGQIGLQYLSGHFVPYPKRGNPPASLLDLTYEKRWPGDEGRLLLTLSREEAPELSVDVDDTVEAELKYETVF